MKPASHRIVRAGLIGAAAFAAIVPPVPAQERARPAPPGVAAREGPDYVLTRRGDDHLGQVLVTGFRFRTEFGSLVFPKQAVARILLAKSAAGDVLTTIHGERVTGKLEGGYLRVSRTAFAPIDLALDEVAEISLTPRPDDLVRPLPALVVALKNGDAIYADPGNAQVTVRSSAVTSTVALAGVRRADFEAFDDGIQVRLVMQDGGRTVSGSLADASVAFVTHAGQEVSIPVRQLLVLGRPAAPGRAQEIATTPAFEAGAPRAAVNRDRLRSGGSGPEMLSIKPGSFRRGDAAGDSDEQPVRTVTIGRAFAIGRYPVTFEEYDLYCERTGRAKPDDEGWGRGRRPVVNVNWTDATAYAQWLARETGERYRLPTNAEFEYATRAGRDTRYPWGDTLSRDAANCGGCGSLWDSRRSAPVGRFAPNGWGLYDMVGNVWQWVADCWDADYRANPDDGSAYTVGGYCDKKVIRGGSWSAEAKEVRSANRWRDFTVRSSDDIGFRVAREAR